MTLLIFIIVLSILIFVHELGHFIVAKLAGIKIEEFAIGFPPKLWSKKVGETRYSINWIPIGGFVRLYGEDDAVSTDADRAFYHKGKLPRALVSVAGVTMNFLLGIVAFTFIFALQGVPKETGQVKVLEVVSDAPAAQAGLRQDDIIVSVDGKNVSQTKAFKQAVEEKKGKDVSFEIRRDSKDLTIKIMPRANPPEGQGPLGVIVSSSEIVHPPFWQMPFVSVWYGTREAVLWVGNTLSGFSSTINQLIKGIIPQEISGPVGIFQITGSFARMGASPLIWFIGVLSINLAVLNAMPFPALDGGRLLFIIIETIFGRRVLPKVERITHTVGLVILLALILLITLHDINRLFNGGFPSLQ